MANSENNDKVAINTDNAILLLAAAQELGLDPAVVRTSSTGYFNVPQDVVDKAGLGGDKQPSESKVAKAAEKVTEGAPAGDLFDPEHTPYAEPEPTPVKTAAKKTTAKKAAATNQKSE